MKQYKTWPPPNWASVPLTWDWCMQHHTHNPNDIFQWVLDAPGGRFHLSGLEDAGGFDYRFENPSDATWFRLNLPR